MGTKLSGGTRPPAKKRHHNHLVETLWQASAAGSLLIGQVAIGTAEEPPTNIWEALAPISQRNKLLIDDCDYLFTSLVSHYDKSSHYVMRVAINGKRVWAIVDTRASTSSISRA